MGSRHGLIILQQVSAAFQQSKDFVDGWRACLPVLLLATAACRKSCSMNNTHDALASAPIVHVPHMCEHMCVYATDLACVPPTQTIHVPYARAQVVDLIKVAMAEDPSIPLPGSAGAGPSTAAAGAPSAAPAAAGQDPASGAAATAGQAPSTSGAAGAGQGSTAAAAAGPSGRALEAARMLNAVLASLASDPGVCGALRSDCGTEWKGWSTGVWLAWLWPLVCVGRSAQIAALGGKGGQQGFGQPGCGLWQRGGGLATGLGPWGVPGGGEGVEGRGVYRGFRAQVAVALGTKGGQWATSQPSLKPCCELFFCIGCGVWGGKGWLRGYWPAWLCPLTLV
eukprot:scaffold75281_cov19-Tisochrysis_lutea.AAC.1